MPGPLPFLWDATSSLEVKGTIRLWYYQSSNCSDNPNTGLEVDVQYTLNGKPYADKTVYGYAMAGEVWCKQSACAHDAVSHACLHAAQSQTYAACMASCE